MAVAEILLDPGVLGPGDLCELHGFVAAAARGGVAVLPWRGDWLQARRSDRIEAVAGVGELGERNFDQCVVHLQKSRPGTWQDLADGWQRLVPGGSLLLVGGNDLGVKSAVARLNRELGASGEILQNRAHGRVVRYIKEGAAAPVAPALGPVDADLGCSEHSSLTTHPGVFSATRLDGGTALLLDCVIRIAAPARVFDAGCGIGPLGISLLRRFPGCRALLADADARAVACAEQNVRAAGVGSRCEVCWWDASEPAPIDGCDLALVNPPFHYHSRKAVAVAPAHELFRAAVSALAAGGIALVVANRSLPYEATLAQLGTTRHLIDRNGYKVIEVRKAPVQSSG